MPVLIRICTALAVFLPATMPVMAADPEPPLQALRHKNYNLVSAERINDQVIDGRILVRIVERLKGDTTSPEEIDLIVQAGDAELIRPGERFLIFYSDVERVNFKVRKEMRNPERRRVLHIEGADPAVYADTPEMRALFSTDHVEIENSPRYREVVFDGLRSGDPGLVDLWSAEWTIRGQFSDIRPKEGDTIGAVISDPVQRPSARSRLLMIATERGDDSQARSFADSARRILDEVNPPDLVENTGLSQLIYASLLVSRKFPEPSGAPVLTKWLGSTPPLAENAALALRAISSELERESVAAAVNNAGIPQPTRDFLAGHLRRLDLAMEDQEKGQIN